jgi:hypothetical protein
MLAIGYHCYSISVVTLRLHEFCCRTIVISDYYELNSTIWGDLLWRNGHLKFHENLTTVAELKHADGQTWPSL